MSYWVYLTEGGEGTRLLTVERFQDGGTQPVGGTDVAELNVTYNYGEVYAALQRANPDLLYFPSDLHLKRAADVTPALEWAVRVCGERRFKDYWAPTPGNAGAALSRLLDWARQHPEGIFVVH